MQPDDRQNQTWQPPTEQPSQAPYVSATPPADPVTPPVQPPSSAPSPYVEPSQYPAEPAEPPYDDEPALSVAGAPVDDRAVRWQASEYIQRDKSFGWYVIFVLVTLGLMALAIFVMKTFTFALLIPVMAVALLVYSRRPPRQIDYVLSRQGLHINEKLYPFADFKGFTIIHGDDEYSIMLIPTKRFRPGVSVYFPEDAGETIVDMLAARMPMSQAKLDLVDQVIRKLRI